MVVPQVSKREQVLELLTQKVALEARIKDHGTVLKTNNVRMEDPLVDADGFPRNDIDVYQVRHARCEIIRLQNDLRALVLQIESGLHAIHAETASTETTTAATIAISDGSSAGTTAATVQPLHSKPCVRVTSVQPNSPAERAGLHTDHEIIEFGTVNATNFRGLSQVGDIVKHSVDKAIRLRVQNRADGRQEELELVPARWAGAGLLGCVIVPMSGEQIH